MAEAPLSITRVATRVASKYRRTLAAGLACRRVPLTLARPVVSFTFDDAPRSAFSVGGQILRDHGAFGTFYVSLGLLSQTTEIGLMGGLEDLATAVHDGHEVGCHTFGHVDAWELPTKAYLDSVDENGRRLAELFPGRKFRTFAYPKNGATWAVKSPLASRFDACRGGGQVPNFGSVDLNLLCACFLDRRAGLDEDAVRSLVEHTCNACGWLILAAHDVSEREHPYSCSPRLLQAAARCAQVSGAALLPVVDVVRMIRGAPR